MDALLPRIGLCAAITVSLGASHRTANFIVSASSPDLAREIGEAAERYRADLAQQWLGRTLPRWHQPCPIQVQVNPQLGAGVLTSFMFDTEARQFGRVPVGDGLFQAAPSGRPFGWEMSIQGSRERVLDSVLPHEVLHTIFATHFGRPLPRWADEGACTTVEHTSERSKQHRLLYKFLTTGQGIAFNRMFAMTEYPANILPLYSQGYSLARFLIAQGGRQKFVRYVGDGLESNNWTAATMRHYGFKNLSELQLTWVDWVRHGSPPVTPRINNANESAIADRGPGTQPDNLAVATPVSDSESSGSGWYARRSAKARATTSTTRSFAPTDERRRGGPSPRASSAAPIGRPGTRELADVQNGGPRQSARPQSNQSVGEKVFQWGGP